MSDYVRDARTLTAEFARHRDTEQAFGARRGDRLLRKTGLFVDHSGMRAAIATTLSTRARQSEVGGIRSARGKVAVPPCVADPKLLRDA